MAAETLLDHTIDSFLGGRVTLVQPRKGHRAGLDAALLQAVIPADASGLLVDLGAGVGTVAFSAAARAHALTAVAVEREPGLVALAREALRAPENAGLAERVRVVMADAAAAGEIDKALGGRTADWVLMNPPFDTPGRGRPSPDQGRRSAHVGADGLLEAWCATAAALVRPGGLLGLIHRAGTLPAVLQALSGAFGDVRVLPAHPATDAAASRIVVRAERGSRAPFRLLPGLTLHRAGGAWTEEADAILKGHASLSFG
jgi:tRNA1(Val) A37 N6-methylase TrmN6